MSAAMALCGRPCVLVLLLLASARLVAWARVRLISMPSDQARVWVVPQCWRASSSAMRAVPIPSKSESSAIVRPWCGGAS
eukprot:3601012-Prorocentrum_lima.AAC.1